MKYSLLTCAGIALAAGVFAQSSTPAGAVFIMNNNPDKNEVIQYNRATNGALQKVRAFPTGGRGSGGVTDPLESQGSLVLSSDDSMLFAVNAGSGDISVFQVFPFGLELVDLEPSGGSSPVAVAQYGDLLYVLNSSGSSNVTGFQVTASGRLRPISGSTRFLTTNTAGAASLAFSLDGKFLAVTERLTNNIDTFNVQADGTLSPIIVTQSAAPGVFSVLFAKADILVAVSTGPAGAQNGSLLSSYGLGANGTISPISPNAATLGAAACWHVITPDDRFVYASNSATGTISGFALGASGVLTALPGTIEATNPTGSTNLDLAVSADGKFLYSLNVGTGVIGIFAINDDGTLATVGTASGITPQVGFNGIAAY
jgi:6-phosphogluconolactonase